MLCGYVVSIVIIRTFIWERTTMFDIAEMKIRKIRKNQKAESHQKKWSKSENFWKIRRSGQPGPDIDQLHCYRIILLFDTLCYNLVFFYTICCFFFSLYSSGISYKNIIFLHCLVYTIYGIRQMNCLTHIPY